MKKSPNPCWTFPEEPILAEVACHAGDRNVTTVEIPPLAFTAQETHLPPLRLVKLAEFLAQRVP